MKKQPFWSEGIRFQCQGSGNCCVSRGGYGHVYLTKRDRKSLAKHLKISIASFTKLYCERRGGIWRLRDGKTDECMFLRETKCSVYKARPMQCRTWPFWPENLNVRTWSGEVAKFCPGVGKGRIWSEREIKTQLDLQMDSEVEYGS